MKKIAYILLVTMAVMGCVTTQTVNLGKLTIGMTKAQVRNIVGPPERVLSVNQTREGFQEVLQYRTAYDEIYALEFWNDYLTGYEFLYDDIVYVPAPPPIVRPPFGQPIFPNYRPNRPIRPPAPRPPVVRPPANNRPPSRPPNNPPNSDRPPNPNPPNRPGATERPETRPSPSPSQNVRPSTRPSDTDTPDRGSSGTRQESDRSRLER